MSSRISRLSLIVAAGALLALPGCASFVGGAAAGAAGAGAAYEYQNKRQLDRLEADLARERISRQEYERRRREIEKGSLIY